MEDQDLKNGKPVDSIESEDSCDDSDEYDEDDEDIETFESMGLDQKLLHAIADIGWNRPTLIQAKAIPLALKGHDILARARTGTGKTGAFILPILEKLLNAKKYENNGESSNQIRALVLAPSKELCNQIQQNFHELTKYCRREVNIMDLSQGSINDKKDFLKIQTPDILIGTPKKVLEYIESKLLNTLKDNLKYLVIDESDLMFSFGYYDDLLKIFKHLPSNGVQHYLMSATLNTDVNEMKKLILNNPIILKLEEPDLPESELLKQYHIEVFDDEEKFVLINALLKLGLIIGKTIIFLSNIDRCYRLRLFLEQFGIRSCVLNSELPITIRCQIIEQFNSGLYDIIIASDEKCLIDPNRRQNDKSSKNNRSKSKVTNSESSIARGIDFKFVSNIINFDFPTTVDSYIHRVGRTARGINNTSNNNCEGNVLSFILPEEQKYFERLQRKFQKQSPSSSSDSIIKPYQFRMNELEAFRYRSRDVLRSITTIVIRNTRLREIQRELLQSKKLQTTFFQKNPKDYKLLKYDRSKLQSSIKQSNNRLHLKDMPDYMIPKTLKTINKSIKRRNDQRIEQQALMSYQPSITKKRRQNQNYKGKHNNSNVKNDPLQTFRMNMIQKYKNKKRNKSRK